MITIDKVVGNIKKDQKLREKYDDFCTRKLCETVKITRLESSRVRMRKASDKGTDVALILPQGARLRDGDIIMLEPDKLIIIEIEPENVAMIEIENNIEQDHVDRGSCQGRPYNRESPSAYKTGRKQDLLSNSGRC